MSVQVLPDSFSQWAIYEESNPEVVSGTDAAYGDASAVACLGRGTESACSVDVFANGAWIAIAAQGINVDASLSNQAVAEHVSPLISDIVRKITDAPSPTPAWTAPATTGALPADCTVYATAEEFRALFGATGEIIIGGDNDGDGWGIENAAWTSVGVERCMWVPESTGQTWPLYITALPGGEWAFDRSAVLMTAGDAVQEVADIAGVSRATFGCHVYSGFCTLDAVIEGNWVEFSAEKVAIGSEDEVRAQLRDMAARAVARFPA
ncbi:hypothetical protein GY21_17000 [Cryobacterium roopkundense]|uniref:Uncharacterized protein n=1 Tax=Cryobacterium roopkundense TaxID=1001240 RepID=A0A099J3U2_9MICO|nr:hypothetical protein [Cryobacterium roopkundense]KGJ72192.1 hypothetical protein GY21_17000 [Cryobacterium roopkundense]MBB5642136.1 hypothetical protein [Cryobacterium roopkundense]